MKAFVLVVLLFLPKAHADDWLCTETASQRIGTGKYLACGIGEAFAEAEARNLSLKNAIQEFKGFCESSSQCRIRQVDFSPKRTTCEKVDSGYKCYRAVLAVLGNKIENSNLSDAELEREINLKKKELRQIQERMEKQRELKALESEVNESNRDTIELETAEIGLYQSEYRASSIKSLWFKRLSFGLGGSPVEGLSMLSITLNGGVEFLPLPYLRFNGLLGYVYGDAGENFNSSTDETREHQLRGLDVQITAGYSIAPFWLDLGAGFFGGSYAQNGIDATSGRVIELNRLNLNLPFYSAQIEYEREIAFFTVEFRKYQSNNNQMKVGNELRFYIGGKW